MSSLQSENGLVHLRHLTIHLQLIVWMLGTNVFEVQPALPPCLLCSPPPHCKVLPLLFQISLSIINSFSHPLPRAPLLSPPLPFFTLRLIDSLPFSPAPPSGFSATTWHQFHSEYSFAPPLCSLFFPLICSFTQSNHPPPFHIYPSAIEGHSNVCREPCSDAQFPAFFSDECQNSRFHRSYDRWCSAKIQKCFSFSVWAQTLLHRIDFSSSLWAGDVLVCVISAQKGVISAQKAISSCATCFFFTCIVCHNSLFDE